ncbi:MAG TPA: hypothetical protein VEF07_00950, partial [Candidatus Binataceae bacterium]|nr:hypothetical protein [Candidatus Binataceae bacterium]
MPVAPNRTLLVIGYGSLLSGYGMLAERRGGGSKLIARDAFPVSLRNARRGLAKPSSHGSYLAMDLEPTRADQPITARAGSDRSQGEIGALGLVFDREWAPLISRREEYEPAKFLELLDLADRAGRPLGELLLAVADRTRFNLLAYRSALREMVGYTSHGYIFHPVPLEDGRVAIAAIGSGYEGSGDPAVRSKRNEFGMDRLLALPEALGVRTLELDRDGQVGYFVECILGGVHGVGVADLIAGLEPEPELHAEVARRVSAVLANERSRFIRATSLDESRYHRAFGAPDSSLAPLLSLGSACQ